MKIKLIAILTATILCISPYATVFAADDTNVNFRKISEELKCSEAEL